MINPLGFLNLNFGKGNTSGWFALEDKEKTEIIDKRNKLNKIQANNSFQQNFSYKHIYTNNTDVEGNLSKMKKYKRITTQGGSLYSFDIETLGMVDGMPSKNMQATELDKELAAITEMGLFKRTYDTNGNIIEEIDLFGGQNQKKVGINPKKFDKYDNLLRRAQNNFQSLNATERSTVQRLAFYIDPNASSRDISKAKEGLIKLRNEGQEFMSGYDSYDDAFENYIKRFNNTINKIKNDGELLVGYNTNTFDIPFINNFSKQKGFNTQIMGSNHLDLIEPLNFSLKDDFFGLHQRIQNANNVDTPIRSGFGRLEKFAESFGLSITSHNAADDSKATLDVTTRKIDNKTGESILDLMLEDASNKVHVDAKEINHKTIQEKIFGFRTSGKLKKFDRVFENGEPVDNLTYGPNRKNFYKSDGIRFIPRHELSKEIIDEYNVEEGLYSTVLKNRSSTRNQEVQIYRSSKSEIFDMLRNKAEIYDEGTIANQFIDASTIEYSLDKTRRRFEKFFQANESGFYDFKNFIQAYEDAKKINPNITKKELEQILKGDPDKIDELFPSLNYNGKLIKSKARDFIAMYDIIDESYDTFKPLSEEIDNLKFTDAKGKGIHYTQSNPMKTRVLSDSLDELLAGEDLTKTDVYYRNQQFDLNALDEIDIINSKNKSEYKRINLGNKKALTYSLLNDAKSEMEFTHLKSVQEENTIRIIEKKAEDLIQRGLLDEDVLVGSAKLDNRTSYYLADAIASNLHNRHARIKNELKQGYITPNAIRNHKDFDILQNYHKQEIKTFSPVVRKKVNFKNETIKNTVLNNYENVKQKSKSRNIFMYDKNKNYAKSGVEGEGLYDALRNQFGYSESNIEELDSVLKGYTLNGYGIAIYEEDDILKLGLQYNDPSNVTSAIKDKRARDTHLYQKIMNGEKPDDMIEVRLPRIRQTDAGEYIEIGGIKKLNEKKVSVYFGNKEAQGLNKLTVRESDLVNETLAGLRKVQRNTTQHMGKGFSKDTAQRNMRNAIEEPINLGPGHSSNRTIRRGEKMFRVPFPNQKDYLVGRSQIDIKPLANYVPFVYDKALEEGNDKLAKEMERAFTDDKMDGKKRLKILKGKIERGERYRDLIDFERDFNTDAKDWMLRELLGPSKIEGEVNPDRLIDHIKAVNHSQEAETLLDVLSRQGTMINKSKHTGHGKAFKFNPINYVPFGFMSDQSRDVVLQQLSAKGIDLQDEKYTDEYLEMLAKEYDVTLGRDFSTYGSLEYENLVKGKMESGIMGNLKQTTSGDLYRQFETFRNEINELTDEEVIKEYGFGKKEINESIEKYMANSDLYENSMLINPTVKEAFFDSQDLMSVKYDTDKGVEFLPKKGMAIGRKVKKGEVIGELHYANGVIKKVRNKKENGIIRNFEKGRVFLEPEKPQTNAVKIIAENAEKGMATVVDDSPVGKMVWQRNIGNNIATVGRFEEVKHTNFNFRFSGELNKIAKRARELGDDEQQKLVERFNKNKALGFNASLDDGKIVIEGNPKAKGGFIQETSDIIEEYRSNPKYSKELSDESVLRVHIGQGQHSDIYSAQGKADEIGKGMKVNGRLLDSVTMRSDLKYQEKVNGKYQSVSLPIYNNLIERSKQVTDAEGRLTDFGMAKMDARNMKAVLDYAGDNQNIPNEKLKIIPMSIDDFGDVKGLRSADKLRDSVYMTDNLGMPKMGDIFEVDLGDIEITDPVTKNKTNKVMIPFLNSHIIGENVVNSDAQKSVADFIHQVNLIKEGKIGNIENANRKADQLYMDMFDRFTYETKSVNSQTGTKIDSGRLDYSGQSLSGNIISPEFEDEEFTKLVNKHYMSDDLIEVAEDGTKKYRDIAYFSNDYLEAMGVDFGTIGEDIKRIDEEFFNRTINQLGIKEVDLDTKAFDIIGRKYAREVGIDAQLFRYPTMLDTSHRSIIARLDDSLEGKTASLMNWTADALNDDSDGDKPSIALNIDKEGHLYPEDDPLTIAHRKTMDAQAIDNADLIEDIVESYNSKNFATSKEEFLSNIEEKTGQTIAELDKASNKSRSIGKYKTVINSKVSKLQIGYISNPNYALREATKNIMNKTEQDLMDRNTLIQDFTNLTEQKLLDTKHETEITKNIANQYSKAMNDMSHGKEEGFQSMREILRTKIHTGDEGVEKTEQVMGALRRTFNNDTVVEKFNDAMVYQNQSNITFLNDSNNEFGKSYIGANEKAITPTEIRMNEVTDNMNNVQIINFDENDVLINNGEIIHDDGMRYDNPNKLETDVFKVKNIDRKNYDVTLLDSAGNERIVKPNDLNVIEGRKDFDSFQDAINQNIAQKRDYIISETTRSINNKTKNKKRRIMHTQRAKYFNEISKLSDEENTVAKRKALHKKYTDETIDSGLFNVDKRTFNYDKAFDKFENLSDTDQKAYAQAHNMFFKDKMPIHEEFETKLLGYTEKTGILADGSEARSLLKSFDDELKRVDDLDRASEIGDSILANAFKNHEEGFEINKMAEASFGRDLYKSGHKKMRQQAEETLNKIDETLDSGKRAASETSQKTARESVGKFSKYGNKIDDALSSSYKTANKVFGNLTAGKIGVGAAVALGTGIVLNNLSDNAPTVSQRRSMPYSNNKKQQFTLSNNSITPSSSYKNISDGKPKGNITVKAKKSTDDIRLDAIKKIFSDSTKSNLNVKIDDNLNTVDDNWIQDKLLDFL